ncbi:3-phosphoshikimate 1-carboxyvinyltransferase [Pseudomaricurvus alcaniphilus]|uniref:3-phosphoshikimate 1-carboxyvinyltransferase n=1 Tax=Pseudomaricurvus alcaniphilus TaxID=1166482 RepID=UPI00140B041C|nr:3-phosphoshikimate 1-carboxyvinyltransferase [Pseudomaricurvus alcaniphilus]NHN39597.1 3-phosphoshikimate 1-carboxyvinyltransferase [Pseudomaricurvus alcaniphilus]
MNKPHHEFATEDQTVINNFLSRVPQEVAESFNEEQLAHIKAVFGAKTWGNHSVDLRGTLRIPLVPKRFYYVILLGKNRRQLTRSEQQISLLAKTLAIGTVLLVSVLTGLLVLYLIKSALGINLFPNFSLGIWGWFKGQF